MLVFLLLLIFIRPFISSLAFPYLNTIYSLALMGLLLLGVLSKGALLKQIISIKYPFILFCIAVLISLIFSQNKPKSLQEVYNYILGLLMFLTAGSLIYKERVRLIRIVTLAGLIISLLAVYQYLFGFQHILNYAQKKGISDPFILDYISNKRVFFPFLNPNILAGYLAMIAPLLLNYKKRFLLLMPISFALLLSKSLGALLSLFLAMPVYFYFRGKLKKRYILTLIMLPIIIVAMFISRSKIQKEHFKPAFSTEMRLGYWQDTLKIIRERPLAGVGLGNFNLKHARYAHNSYLQLWAEMGILGIISFLWLIILVIKSAVKNLSTSPDKGQTACLLTACFVFLFHNFIDFTFFLPEISLIWWAIMGLIAFRESDNL